MRISDWSSDVCSSDLPGSTSIRSGGARNDRDAFPRVPATTRKGAGGDASRYAASGKSRIRARLLWAGSHKHVWQLPRRPRSIQVGSRIGGSHVPGNGTRSEEHTSELQSLMRIS